MRERITFTLQKSSLSLKKNWQLKFLLGNFRRQVYYCVHFKFRHFHLCRSHKFSPAEFKNIFYYEKKLYINF